VQIPEKVRKLLIPPASVDELKIPVALPTDLVFRVLFREGVVNLARFVEVLKLHTQLLDEILVHLQREHLVEITKTGGGIGRLGYSYSLTDAGMKRSRDALERSQYIGPTPVDLNTYRDVIIAQTEQRLEVKPQDVKDALQSLVLPENFHRRIGPAVSSGSSLFLYGPPGNGKTTVAQLIGGMLGHTEPIFLPYALTVGGQIIQVRDPLVHIPWEDKTPSTNGTSAKPGSKPLGIKNKIDARWALCQRPAVMVGGELTMDSLDLRYEPIAKIYEAPLQLKANGGMFLIDDFGRQQISPHELLNRWIVPLESGIDFLRLQSGQTLEMPFRQLIVFCTNLDPSDLVDGAFLRRIQMKVEVGGPDEKKYFQIFVGACQAYNVPFDKECFMYLLKSWYRDTNRVMQSVHPRDIVKTVVSICEYEDIPVRLSPELIDEACESYFVDLA
jgi:predicted ATPase with chaperone activity